MSPKVSIALITYNHEKFIRQAIEGILIQTYENYEIVIADDSSIDRTLQIVEEYSNRLPGRFKILKNVTNIGASKNFKKLLESCDGKYVALLDGDDFWINPEKLTIQVDFLEKNQEYVLAFHQSRILKEVDVRFGDFIPSKISKQEEFSIVDVMNDLFMPTASVVFRNGKIKKIPDWFEKLIVCDKPLHLMNLLYGEIKYFNECMSVYRIHESGIWSTQRFEKRVEFDKNKIYMLENFNEYSNLIYEKEIKLAIKRCDMRIFINQLKNLKNLKLDEKDVMKIETNKKEISKYLISKKVYIFGTGEAGCDAYNVMNFCGIQVQGFLDNNPLKHDKEIYNKKIISPNNLTREKETFIVVGSMYYSEIKEQLINSGYVENIDFIPNVETLHLIEKFKTEEVSC